MKNVLIKDPTSHRVLVRLRPKQKLQLVCSDPSVRVNVSGLFLSTKSIGVTKEQFRELIIEPTKDILPSSTVATHYLGEVIIGTQASLLVYMEDSKSNCKDVVAVVNPFNDSIRIRPYQIVEYLFCSETDKKITWTWRPQVNIDLAEIYAATSVSGKKTRSRCDALFMPNSRDIFEDGTKVHHFWFYLSSEVLEAVVSNAGKNTYLGRLWVVGQDGSAVDETFVDLYGDLASKYLHQTREHHSWLNGINFRQDVHRSYDHDDLPKLMSVDIKRIKSVPFGIGCKTMELKIG